MSFSISSQINLMFSNFDNILPIYDIYFWKWNKPPIIKLNFDCNYFVGAIFFSRKWNNLVHLNAALLILSSLKKKKWSINMKSQSFTKMASGSFFGIFFFKIRLNFSESKYLLLALIMERLHSCWNVYSFTHP